jgi:hypothetical protein
MAKKDNSALAWLIGLGTLTVAGVGIYFYEKSQPAAPTTAPGGAAATGPASLTPAQAAALAASFNGTTLAAWQASGIPSAIYTQLTPLAQSGINAAGIRQV